MRPVVRLHLWVEAGGGTLLGLGRTRLLEKIEEHGSLKRAAESMGMSYRAAWGKIRASEAVLGAPLIERLGAKKSGHALTKQGKDLMLAYQRWFTEVERHALAAARELLPFESRGFGQADGCPDGAV